jgi:formylglycine-generating enzyme required for sulfatase activity
MSDDVARLERFRKRLETTDDPLDRADLEATIADLEAKLRRAHELNLGGHAQAGVAVAGDVGGGVVAPLFPTGASGNYIAGVINLYRDTPAAPQADYDAALRRYLRHLYVSHATLDLRGIDQRQMDMPLSEVYVSLSVREVAPAEGVVRGAFRAVIERVRQMSGKADPSPEGPEQVVEWTQILRHPRLAVIGLPGSGKTTLLQYTTVRLCEVLARDDATRLADLGLDAAGVDAPPVPLLLPLRELGAFLGESRIRELAGANARLLLDCLANYYNGFDLDLPADFFRRLCDAGRAILLLDGLDEVPQTDDRVLVSAIVRGFVGRYPRCRYVLTSRPKAYEGDARLGQGFRECTVDDLTPEKQQLFIRNWSQSLFRMLGHAPEEAERGAARFGDELWAALEANQRVRDLATNPLLLTIIAIIYYDSRSLPENRAELYEACVTVLLKGGRGKVDRAAKQRETYSGRPSVTMSLRQKRELLAFVAYHMHVRGAAQRESTGREIGRDDLLQIVAAAPALSVGMLPREAAEAFVDELPVHVGLLDEIRPEIFRFSHLSFQEFLAARYVAEGERWGELLDHAQEPWWREVILLCAGHLSQERCWRFLEQLTERGNDDTARAEALALAADAIAELEKFKGQGPLNARIQAEALRILQLQPATAVPAKARVASGRALAIAGDPRPGVCTLPPDMVAIPGGTFQIGITEAEHRRIIEAERANKQADEAKRWYQDTLNQQPVQIAPFELARYPVTNAQYALFIADGGYEPQQAWWDDAARAWLARDDKATGGLERWQRRTNKEQPEYWNNAQIGVARSNHPVVGISWYEAMAFCRWLTRNQQHNPTRDEYQLPSELEWEYAARGIARRTYSWGEEPPDSERANFNQAYGSTTAVGCFPSGATPDTELLDMTGNVWEWTRSVYQPYPYDPADGRENSAEPSKKHFTLRGGSWVDPPVNLRAVSRLHFTPDSFYDTVGFRLARHPPRVKN